MPFIIADRVRETSATVGTGSIALAGAVTGYRTFGSVLASTDTTFYTIADQGGPNWEVGIGTFTAPSTLARTTVLSSSNGGSLVNFTAGTKDVFISLTASRTNVSDQPNVIDTSSSSAALRITQTGSGNSILVEDSANPDATPFVVDANGNVGIGTTLPGYKLEVRGAAGSIGAVVTAANAGGNAQININSGFNSTVPVYGFWFNGDTGLGNPANQTASVITAGSERMRVDASGNVGIGTALPGTRLDVSGSIRASQSMTIGNGGGTYQAGSIYSDGNWGMIFRAAQASPALAMFRWSDASDVERMRVDPSGNLLLGTATVRGRLTVVGGQAGANTSSASFSVPGAAQGELADLALYSTFTGTGDNGPRRTADILAGFSGGAWGAEYLSFNVGNNGAANDGAVVTSEKARITNAGNVLVNTTTAVSRLTVNGDVAGTFFVNPTTVSANYTIPTNYNAMTAGPITVNSGVTVTVPSGSTWTVV